MSARCHSCGGEQRVGHRCEGDPCPKCNGPTYQRTLDWLPGAGWLVGHEPCPRVQCRQQLQEEKKP